jgi:hypothetical protein
MIADSEIDALAQTLIGQHGPLAPKEAEQRALRMQDRGDKYGVAHWRRVKKTAERILAQQ